MFELGISTEQIMGFLLVFARVGAWVWLTPPFGGGFLPPLVRIMAGLAFAIPMTPGAIAASGGISLDPVNLLLQFALQVVIGGRARKLRVRGDSEWLYEHCICLSIERAA